MHLTPVEEATQLILAQKISFGTDYISLSSAKGRVLAAPLVADRDFPPFDRVTMDGIAIAHEAIAKGLTSFKIQTMQGAGDPPTTLESIEHCIEIMTGAVLPHATDTVIRYEDLTIKNGVAYVNEAVKPFQNVHKKGEDRKESSVIVEENTLLRSPEIAVAASVGASNVVVKALPKVVIITSGDELVSVETQPLPHQIKTSNVYAIASLISDYSISATQLHIPDDFEITKKVMADVLSTYDVVLLSGGVSKGKKDFIPAALEENGVEKIFHRVEQTPGKPFWFGRKNDCLVFALPGNPVSSFMCARRYFIPWLRQSIGLQPFDYQEAILKEDFYFKSPLTFFLQVILEQKNATTFATPLTGHGSGDFANLVNAQAFMELPAGERRHFKAGELFKIWMF